MSRPSGFKEQTPQPSDAAKALGPKDPGIDGSVFGSECACGCQQRVAQYRDAIAHTLTPNPRIPMQIQNHQHVVHRGSTILLVDSRSMQEQSEIAAAIVAVQAAAAAVAGPATEWA